MFRTLVAFTALLAVSACGRTPVDDIRSRTIAECPSATLGEIEDAFFFNSRWAVYADGEGGRLNSELWLLAGHVNIATEDYPVNVDLIFFRDMDTGEMIYDGLQLNREPMGDIEARGLITRFCQALVS